MKKNLKLKFSIDRFIEYGTYLLVFLLPIQTRYFLKTAYLSGEYWELGSISLYLSDLLIVFLLALLIFQIIRNRNFSKINNIWILLGIFEFFVFISIFFSSSLMLSIYGYIKLLLGFSLLFLLTNIKLSSKVISISFISSVFFQSTVGLFQYLFNFSPANKYIGIAKHDPSELGVFVVELADKARILRSYGTLDHPNIYGAFVFLGVLILSKYILKYQKKTYLLYLLLSFFSFSLFLSFSRAVYLVVFLYLCFLSFIYLKYRNTKEVVIKIFLSILLGFFVFMYFSSPVFYSRLSQDSRLNISSNNERISQALSLSDTIQDSLLFGLGVNSYTNKLVIDDVIEGKPWEYKPVHNTYLIILAEVGVLGLFSFLIFLVYIVFSLIVREYYFDIFILLSFLILMFFDHWFWTLHFGILFMFFALSLIIKSLRY